MLAELYLNEHFHNFASGKRQCPALKRLTITIFLLSTLYSFSVIRNRMRALIKMQQNVNICHTPRTTYSNIESSQVLHPIRTNVL